MTPPPRHPLWAECRAWIANVPHPALWPLGVLVAAVTLVRWRRTLPSARTVGP